MELENYKITAGDVSTHGVVSAPDKLRDTAQNNKRRFDELIRDVVKDKFNGLVDALVAALAGKMPAPGDYGSAGEYLMTDGEGGVSWGTAPGGGDMLRSEFVEEGGNGVVLRAMEADHADTADTAGTAATSGNADTATKLKNARTLTVKDNDQTNAGPAVSFDGSGNIVMRMPAIIKAALSGNADTATKLKSARNIGLASFDGSAGISLAQIGAAAASHTHAASEVTGTSTTLTAWTARRVYISASAPEDSDGSVGDLWIKY